MPDLLQRLRLIAPRRPMPGTVATGPGWWIAGPATPLTGPGLRDLVPSTSPGLDQPVRPLGARRLSA